MIIPLHIPTNHKPGMRSIVVSMGTHNVLPWWLDQVKQDSDLCCLDYERIVFKHKNANPIISTLLLPYLFFRLLPLVIQIWRKYDYVFTVECDYTSFIIAFWQTVFFIRKPKHVIIHFIMREKTNSLTSKFKYAIMVFLFTSVHKVICSSKKEVGYYNKVFGWKNNKAIFIPIQTSAKFLLTPTNDVEGYIFSGGRTFRDFPTLTNALYGTNYKTIIVAGSMNATTPSDQSNIELIANIPIEKFNKMLANSRIVVIPLEDRELSAGQIVILQAMAMGKAVIATRTSGTVDYIEHNKTGILVEPNDPDELRNAIDSLMSNAELRISIGKEAKAFVAENLLPNHYTRNIRRALQQSS